jgi:hypothetical protein
VVRLLLLLVEPLEEGLLCGVLLRRSLRLPPSSFLPWGCETQMPVTVRPPVGGGASPGALVRCELGLQDWEAGPMTRQPQLAGEGSVQAAVRLWAEVALAGDTHPSLKALLQPVPVSQRQLVVVVPLRERAAALVQEQAQGRAAH